MVRVSLLSDTYVLQQWPNPPESSHQQLERFLLLNTSSLVESYRASDNQSNRFIGVVIT